jgi:hypothetical protein
MVWRLPQTLQQLENLLKRWVETGPVSVDSGAFEGDPAAVVNVARSTYSTWSYPPPNGCAVRSNTRRWYRQPEDTANTDDE